MCSPSPVGTAVVEGLQKSIRFEEVLPTWWAAYITARAHCSFGPLRCVTREPSCRGLRGRRRGLLQRSLYGGDSPSCTINFFNQTQNESSLVVEGLLLVFLCEDWIWKQCHTQEKLHELNCRNLPGWEPQTDCYWGARWKPRHTLRRVTCPEKAIT